VTSRKNLSRRVDDLTETRADFQVGDLWKRSAAGEDPLAAPEYRERVLRTVEDHGWPEGWSE
jgi:hypothetical protein